MVRQARRRRRPTNTKSLIKREVASALKSNIELKHSMLAVNQNVSTTTYFNELIEASFEQEGQSLVDGGYVGNEVRLQGMMCRWQLSQVDSTQSYRIMIFEPQPNFTPSTGTTSQWKEPTHPFISPVDKDQVKRVYLDRVVFQRGAVGNPYGQITRGRKYIKLRNRRCQFQDADGIGGRPGLANVKLYLCLLSDSGVVSHPEVTMLTDISYTDA